jgi:ribosomal protein L16 Arg81 hydroxylase
MRFALLFLLLTPIVLSSEEEEKGGGSFCNIPKVHVAEDQELKDSDFPVVYVMPRDEQGRLHNYEFSEMVQRDFLLQHYGDEEVILSSSNSYSHGRHSSTLHDYIESLATMSLSAYRETKSNETHYLFGGNYQPAFVQLYSHYRRPPHPRSGEAALSFGIGGTGSGVAFHIHSDGFSEVFHGSKRWLLFPPDEIFEFDPNSSTWSYVTEILPHLPEHGRPLDCTIRPGEILYFPANWHHAVLNVGDFTVFMSTFL